MTDKRWHSHILGAWFSKELTVNCKFWGQTVSMYISISEVWYGEIQTEKAEQGGSHRRLLQLENLDDNMDTNRAYENIWGNFKISAKESLGQYKHKSAVWWRMCKFVQQRKQPVLLCGNRTQDILMLINNVKNDLSTDFRNKGKNFWEVNLINLKLTVKTWISETGKGPSINRTRVICWQTPTVFWMSRGPFFSVAKCTWELTICSVTHTQQSYLCLSPVPL